MANSKISALPSATSLTGAEVIPIVQGGVNKKVTKNLLLGGLPYATLSGTIWDGTPKAKLLTANLALTLSTTYRSGKMRVQQDATGGRTLTINSISIPVLTAPNSVTVVLFDYNDVTSTYDYFVDTSYAGNTSAVIATQLAPPSVAAIVISSSEIDLSWANITGNSGYRVYFNGTNSFGGASLLATLSTGTNSYHHTGLGSALTFYYWVVALGNSTTYTDSNQSAVASATTSSSGGLVDILFATQSPASCLVNTSGIWTTVNAAAGSPTYGNKGLDAKKIALGSASYIQMDINMASHNFPYGIKAGNAVGGVSNMIYGMSLSSNQIYGIDSGVFDPVPSSTFSNGNLARVYVPISGFPTLDVSTDGGTTWTTIKTFSVARPNTDLFIVCDAYDTGQLNNPKGYNLV